MSDNSYISSDVMYLCDTDEYYYYLSTLVYPTLAVLLILIPGFFYYKLYQASKEDPS